MAFKVPLGHIAVDNRWNGTELCTTLSRNVTVIRFNCAENIDFYLPNDLAVIYVTEAEQISGIDYKKKITNFKKKVNSHRRIVCVDKTHVTLEYFFELQKLIVMELDLQLFPTFGPNSCAEFLTYMVRMESSERPNVFQEHPRVPPTQMSVLNALCKLPSLGKKKALALMDNFENLTAIACAPVEDLEKVIGHSSATQVYKYFNQL